MTPLKRLAGIWLLRLLALAALAMVFMAYQNPHFTVDLANLVWSCF